MPYPRVNGALPRPRTAPYVPDESGALIPLPPIPGGLESTYGSGQHAGRGMLTTRELLQQLHATIPLGVEVYKIYPHRLALPRGSLQLVLLKAHIPAAKEQDVRAWENDFEQRHGLALLIDRSKAYSGRKELLREIAGGDSLLSSRHRSMVTEKLTQLFGNPPALPPPLRRAAQQEIAALPDMTSIPFMAIDPQSVRDREDLCHAEYQPISNHLKVRVAFVDVTTFAKPHSAHDRYARQMGRTIYGSRCNRPTLGDEAAYGLGSFSEGQDRSAFVVELTLDAGGAIIAQKVQRARVRNHQSLDPEHFELCRLQGCSAVLKALSDATGRLRARRQRASFIERVDRDDPGAEIVAECMIAAKSELARFLHGSQTPAIYRVLAPVSDAQLRSLIAEVRAAGIDARESDLRNPLRLAALMRCLEDRNERVLLEHVVDMFLGRGRFDTRNLGHAGIGTDAYLEIKPREYSGLVNQFQLRAVLEGCQGGVLSPEDIEQRTNQRNRQRAAEEPLEFKLRFLERLQDALGQVGQVFRGRVVKVAGDVVLFDIPGFSRWGVVLRHALPRGSAVRAGDVLALRLLGYSTRRDRYQFAIEERENRDSKVSARNVQDARRLRS